jgi:hypothetical protein
LPLVGSAVVALWGLVWGWGLRCDESCNGRPWPALACVGIGALTIVATLSWWGTDWSDEFARHPLPFGAFACVVLPGALAAFLCAPAEARARTG